MPARRACGIRTLWFPWVASFDAVIEGRTASARHAQEPLRAAQVIRFAVGDGAAARRTVLDTSAVLPSSDGTNLLCVRVVSADAAETRLLLGGISYASDPDTGAEANRTVLVFGSVPAGGDVLEVLGLAILPDADVNDADYGNGVQLNGDYPYGLFALSATSALSPGWVLASTRTGIFKCEHIVLAPTSGIKGMYACQCRSRSGCVCRPAARQSGLLMLLCQVCHGRRCLPAWASHCVRADLRHSCSLYTINLGVCAMPR